MDARFAITRFGPKNNFAALFWIPFVWKKRQSTNCEICVQKFKNLFVKNSKKLTNEDQRFKKVPAKSCFFKHVLDKFRSSFNKIFYVSVLAYVPHIVAIGNPERHVRKASYSGSKQQ